MRTCLVGRCPVNGDASPSVALLIAIREVRGDKMPVTPLDGALCSAVALYMS